jgi:predicted RND superfamily exporter protein
MGQQSFYQRRAVVILVIAAGLVPLIAWGVHRAILSNSNDVRDWLPADYPETRQYAWFTQHFGVQDFIVASWPGCTLDDRRLDEFVRALPQLAASDSEGSPFARVLTGRSLVEQLLAPPVGLSRKSAIARLRGTLVGPDNQQTCALLTLVDGKAPRLEPAIELIRRAAEVAGVSREEVRVGGIPVVNAALNRESSRSLVRLAGLSGLLGVAIAWLCFRNLRLTSLILAVGIYSAAASLAVVPLFGAPLNAVLITMVPLVYVTAVSGAIHLSNYYLDALEHTGPPAAPGRAIAHAAVPLVLAASTTVLGLLSLGYSDLNPIQLFGVFSAVGVALGSAAHFLLLPAALVVWGPKKTGRRVSDTGSAAPSGSHLNLWPQLGAWITSHPGVVLTCCCAAMCVGLAGVPRIRTSIQMMRLFSQRAPVIPMTRWLEERLGATIPLEIVVHFRPESQTTVLDRMRLVAELQTQLLKLPAAGGCLSAATFAPPEVRQTSREGVVRRAVINSKLKSRYGILHQHGWLAQDADEELWRISLRIRGLDDLDYAAFADTLRRHVQPVVIRRLGAGRPGINLTITGTAPIVFKARQSLLDGMLFGLGTDVVLIVVGVLVITRSCLTGAVMFVLSIFPSVVVFGAMGLLGIVVDIGSVMTPCVAVGVTVDDVIHFLLCHRRGVQQGLSTAEAALLAYRTCGRAIVQSWSIIGVGLAAFALSSFVPTFRFGLLMLLLLTAGMVGNLLFLPALLAGPVGRWITKTPAPLTSLVHLVGNTEPAPAESDQAADQGPVSQEISCQ